MIEFSREVSPTGVMVVKLGGRLDFEACDYFFKCMQDEIENGFHRIVVDCEDLGYLSSAGLGMLVRARGRVKKQGGFICLAQLQSGVADLFHFLHMDKVFRIYPTVGDALESVDTHPSTVE